MPDSGDQLDLKLFEENPSLFIENAIREYVATSPGNRLTAFSNAPIFDDVLVGFADGDDPIFQEFKTIIGDFHLTPREIMEIDLKSGRNDWCRGKEQPPRITVINWVLSFAYETRLSWRSENMVSSLMANHATSQGHHFSEDQLLSYVSSMVEALGFRAVPLKSYFKMIPLPDGRTSNWSDKHSAYAAGLGTFGHNSHLITPKGSSTFLGNVVTDLALPPSARTYKNHLENCLFYREGACGRCIERCPSGALSKQGYDKKKCQDYHEQELPELVKRLGIKGYYGVDPGCALCTTKVPCENRIPPSVLGKKQSKDVLR